MAGKKATSAMALPTDNGVYYVSTHQAVAEIKSLAVQSGLLFMHLEGQRIEGKDAFLNHAGVAMHFPDYFGKNWDAFEEMILDLSWFEGDHRGFLVYFDHIDAFYDHHKAELETLVEIFQDAADAWADEDTSFVVLLQGTRKPKGTIAL